MTEHLVEIVFELDLQDFDCHDRKIYLSVDEFMCQMMEHEFGLKMLLA